MHIWEARRCLTKRWSRQKHNRKLKLRIARLTQQAVEYATALTRNNWIGKCNSLSGALSSRNTWRILRYLIEPRSTRGESARNLRCAFHTFQGTNQELAQALENRYFCTAIDEDVASLTYEGEANEALDAPYSFQETKAALASMR